MDAKTLIKQYKKIVADILKINIEHIEFRINNIATDYKLKTEDPKNGWELGVYSLIHTNISDSSDAQTIASWYLWKLPHCCAYAVLGNATVWSPYKQKGIGTVLNAFQQEIAKQLGYTSLLCTDVRNNTPQRQILKKNEWEDIHELVNYRTNNTVILSVKNL
jgi:retron-type reverse transcriptase